MEDFWAEELRLAEAAGDYAEEHGYFGNKVLDIKHALKQKVYNTKGKVIDQKDLRQRAVLVDEMETWIARRVIDYCDRHKMRKLIGFPEVSASSVFETESHNTKTAAALQTQHEAPSASVCSNSVAVTTPAPSLLMAARPRPIRPTSIQASSRHESPIPSLSSWVNGVADSLGSVFRPSFSPRPSSAAQPSEPAGFDGHSATGMAGELSLRSPSTRARVI